MGRRKVCRWSTIATKLPGRSDNKIKNYWNTNLRKRVKQDQLHHKSSGYYNPAKGKENSTRNQIEETSSSGSSSSSPSTSSSPTASTARMQSLSSSASNFDGSLACSNLIPSFGFENAGGFWTDPLLTDVDSVPMNQCSSCFDLAQASSHDMLTDDEFLRSTMNLYDEYHRQLQK
ncbi:hypothetical protein L1987_32269 [Smallanthus sonchifolius]|uniref:Uncharacterized protein n=1 Tax=Smallanthus sonchifolius TaxID=185202 RepID=A0ACB9I795_9ASTR|nr:hypothetical protein L1987_32269 [Smallanthus sonchifolius]